MFVRITFILILCVFVQCSDERNLISEKDRDKITKISLLYHSPSDESIKLRKVLTKPAQIRYFIDNFLRKGRKIRVLKSKHSGIMQLYIAGEIQTLYIRGGGLLVQTPETWFVPSKSMHEVLKELP